MYSGKTALGDGEIVLLERNEIKYNENLKEWEDVVYEIIYAWIPVKGKSWAYQFYLYVPYETDIADTLNQIKKMLEVI